MSEKADQKIEADKKIEAEKAEAEAKGLQLRVQGFQGELIPLLGKYKVGLGAQAYIVSDGRIAARPIIFDDSKPKTTPDENTDTPETAPINEVGNPVEKDELSQA